MSNRVYPEQPPPPGYDNPAMDGHTYPPPPPAYSNPAPPPVFNNAVAPAPGYGAPRVPPKSASSGMWVAIVVIGVIIAVVVFIVVVIVVAVLLAGAGNKKNNDEGCGSHASECSSDNVCMFDEFFCDGLSDCSEGEDEDECGLTCSASEFACADHSECIDLSLRCDQTDDCGDGSDEWDCLTIGENDGEVYLLVRHEDSYRPVCSTDWDSSWDDDTCDEMGFGSASETSSTVSSSSVPESSNGWANPGGTRTDSTLDVLSFSSTCAAATAVKLVCTYDSCGSRGQSVDTTTGIARIINGFDADAGAWPWQIALEVFGNQICGGSLIEPNWVVTAAHCLDDAYDGYYSIRAGSTLVSGSDTYLQTANVEAMFIHEDYNPNTIHNDIALLRLDADLVIDDYVRPVCLPESSEDWSDSVVCYTSGWGSIARSGDDYPDDLQDTRLPLISDADCATNDDIEGVQIFDGSIMQCAGHESAYISTCSGDSGGPLVCRDRRNIWTLAGVTSWGVGTDAEPCQSISVFADVPAFRSWIDTTMAANPGTP